MKPEKFEKKHCDAHCRCDCNRGYNKKHKQHSKSHAKKVGLLLLVVGGVIGVVLGAKYHQEIDKSAHKQLKALEKSKYVPVNKKQADKLAADFRKNAKKLRK